MVVQSLTVASITFGLELPNASWLEPLRQRIGKFFTDLQPEVAVRVVLNPDVAAAPGGEPRVEQAADGMHLCHDQFHAHIPVMGLPELTVYEPGPDPADITYVMAVDSFLRIVLAQALAARGGLMMHAAGLATGTGPEAEGYVFFGPSGSGKTTVCELSHPKRRVLCDEVIAICPQPDGVRLYGTPFSGAWSDSLAEDVPLRGVLWLKQAPHTRRVSIDAATAVRGLLESAVSYDRSPGALAGMLETALALVNRVPVHVLEFERKESLWESVLAPLPAR